MTVGDDYAERDADRRSKIIADLNHAAATACNDDSSRPMTEQRFRHTARVDAMLAAAAYLAGRDDEDA